MAARNKNSGQIMRIPSLIRTVLLTGAFVFPIGNLHADTSFHSANDGQEIIQNTGVANRLAVGEVLRSLTQQIPAAACHLHNGINVDDATALLSAGISQTTELLDALIYGDIFWGIEFPEVRRKTIAEIDALRAAWAPVQNAGFRLLDDPLSAQDAGLVSAVADSLFDRSYALLTTLDGQYSSSAEILSRDVMFIQISGRMTALNQRMALQACQLWSGPFDVDVDVDVDVAANLKQVMQDYEGSLRALTDGLPAMGILPPQTPGIADKLAEINGVWAQTAPLLALVAANEEISEQQRFDLYYQLIDEKVVLLDLVYLYQDHSKVAH